VSADKQNLSIASCDATTTSHNAELSASATCVLSIYFPSAEHVFQTTCVSLVCFKLHDAVLADPPRSNELRRSSRRDPDGPFLSDPVHVHAQYSYLSSELITQKKHSGLVNLGMVIILAANSRLILENIIKYGLRASPIRWFQRAVGSETSRNGYVLSGFVALFLTILAAVAIEHLGVRLLRCVRSSLCSLAIICWLVYAMQVTLISCAFDPRGFGLHAGLNFSSKREQKDYANRRI
jgi:hypothetical protein